MKKIALIVGVFISVGAYAAENTLINPISLHYYRGEYYIGDPGLHAVLRYKVGGKPIVLVNKNFPTDLPTGITDDGKQSLIVGTPNACWLYKININTGKILQFSPKLHTKSKFCSCMVTKYDIDHYAFSTGHYIVTVNKLGNQTGRFVPGFFNTNGVTPFVDTDHTPLFAITNQGKQGDNVIMTVTQSGKEKSRTLITQCDGKKLQYPFGIVTLGDTLYFDDAILNTLFSYDIKTKKCEKISDQFVRPMGLAVAGNKIAILDTGKRALLQYDPVTHELKTLYQDHSPITQLVQPWQLYVTSTNVYMVDSQRNAIIKITKKQPHKMTVVTDQGRGKGAPYIAIAGLTGSGNSLYTSDVSQDIIFRVNSKNGDHTIFSETGVTPGKSFDDPASLTFYKKNIYAGDWSKYAIFKVTSSGRRIIVAKLKTRPYSISSIIDNHLYFIRYNKNVITKVNIATGHASVLSARGATLPSLNSVVFYDKNTLFVAGGAVKKNQYVYRINLVSNACKKIATIPVPYKKYVSFMSRYDKNHLIVNLNAGSQLYLVNIHTGKVTRFLFEK